MPRMLSKPFTTLTPKAKRSLTSGILLLGAGSCHPGLAGTERGTFLTLQRPHGTDLGCWPPPTACRVLQQPPRALRQPGQPCPLYGLCSPTVAYRHYLFYLICKYTKDVVLFIWSIHPHCSSKVKLRFPLLETDVPLQQRATCLCLMPGRMFPHHSWRQRRTELQLHLRTWEHTPEEQGRVLGSWWWFHRSALGHSVSHRAAAGGDTPGKDQERAGRNWGVGGRFLSEWKRLTVDYI